MTWDPRQFLKSICGCNEDAAALSRRDMLAGLGLAGLFVAAPNLLAPTAAEARIAAPPSAPEPPERIDAEQAAKEPADRADLAEVSAQRRYWRRRYWRRRYYWRPRYYRRRYYWRRRRYW